MLGNDDLFDSQPADWRQKIFSLVTKVMSSVTTVAGAFVVETTFQTRSYYCTFLHCAF